jgi:hypothetical protein
MGCVFFSTRRLMGRIHRLAQRGDLPALLSLLSLSPLEVHSIDNEVNQKWSIQHLCLLSYRERFLFSHDCFLLIFIPNSLELTLFKEGISFSLVEQLLYLSFPHQTPLHCAAACGHVDILSSLVANGADVNAIDV